MEKKKTVDKELFGTRLKQLMDENNETTYSLADAINLSAATISRYTTGDSNAKTPIIEAIARYFKVNPAWLMGYDVLKNFKVKNQHKETSIDYKLDPTEHRIRLLARKADNLTEEDKANLIQHLEDTVDMYLRAKGINQ